jgi:hypothetical protein
MPRSSSPPSYCYSYSCSHFQLTACPCDEQLEFATHIVDLVRSHQFAYCGYSSHLLPAGSVVVVSVPEEGSYPIRSESYDCLFMMKRIERSQQEAVSNNYQAHKFSPFGFRFYLSVAIALASEKIGQVAMITTIPKTTSSGK